MDNFAELHSRRAIPSSRQEKEPSGERTAQVQSDQIINTPAVLEHSETKEAEWSTESIVNLALERIKMRQETGQTRAEEVSGQPTTFSQLAVQYLMENKNAISSEIAQNYKIGEQRDHEWTSNIIPYLLDHYIYPQIKDKMAFPSPKGDATQHEPLRLFFDNGFNQAVYNILKAYEYEDGYIRYGTPENKSSSFMLTDKVRDEHNIDQLVHGHMKEKEYLIMKNHYMYFRMWDVWLLLEKLGMNFPGDKVTLVQVIDKITEIANQYFNKPSHGETEAKLSRAMGHVGSDIYYGMQRKLELHKKGILCSNKLGRNIHPTDEKDIGKIIDLVIGSLSSGDEILTGLNLPKFSHLPLLKGQLEKYMQVLAERGKINKVLEAHLFGDKKPITEYRRTIIYGRILWAMMTMGISEPVIYLLKETHELRSNIHKDVKNIYNYMEWVQGLYEMGKTYSENGATERQKNQGGLLTEIASIYAERLHEIGVDVEAQLKVKDINFKRLEHHIETLSSFRHGDVAEQLLDVVANLEKEEKIQAELDQLETPAFRKTLASSK